MKNGFLLLSVLLFCGFAAGFCNGLLGAGGGILLVLSLSALFGKTAVNGRRFFTTALSVMLPLSALSAWQYAACGARFSPAPWPLIGAAGGGVLGALLLWRLPTGVLRRVFAAVLLLSGVLLWR